MRTSLWIVAVGLGCIALGVVLLVATSFENAGYIVSTLGVFVSACSLIPRGSATRTLVLSIGGNAKHSEIRTDSTAAPNGRATVTVNGSLEHSKVELK